MSTNKPNNTLLINISNLMRHKNYSSVQNAPTVIGFGNMQFHQLQTNKALYVEQETKVEDFLKYLVIGRNAASANHNQAFNTLVFKL